MDHSAEGHASTLVFIFALASQFFRAMALQKVKKRSDNANAIAYVAIANINILRVFSSFFNE
jgi:hypothetical protein